MRITIVAATVTLAALSTACNGKRRAEGSVLDQSVPREVALTRFRMGLAPVDTLSGGETTVGGLIASFISALERNDTATLRSLVMTPAEFAYIYYPTNPQSLPPYELGPDLMWFLIETRSRQGAAAALSERGGRPLRYLGFSCDPDASFEGENTVLGPCVVLRLQAPGDTIAERLFGPIIQRRGRFKFVSLANKL